MKKRILIILGVAVIIFAASRIFFNQPEILPVSFEEHWAERPIDHTDPTAGTFRQQILTLRPDGSNDNADLIFILGNETDATTDVLASYWKAYGRPQNTILAISEHRGYGQSIADGDNTVPAYVTVEQALADHAQSLAELRQVWEGQTTAVGCSYGGALAIQFAHDYSDLIDAAISSSAPVRWPFVIPEYSDRVRQNLGDGFTDRLAAHFENREPDQYFDENWKQQQLLAGMVSGLSQRQDSQSLVPVIRALSFLPTGAFVGTIELLMPPEGFHYSHNRVAQTMTAEMARTGEYNWYTWKYQQCTGLGTFFAGSPFGFTEAISNEECQRTFGIESASDASETWDVESLIPDIEVPLAIIVGGKDPWTEYAVQANHGIENILYIADDEGYHCPDKTNPKTAETALSGLRDLISTE